MPEQHPAWLTFRDERLEAKFLRWNNGQLLWVRTFLVLGHSEQPMSNA